MGCVCSKPRCQCGGRGPGWGGGARPEVEDRIQEDGWRDGALGADRGAPSGVERGENEGAPDSGRGRGPNDSARQRRRHGKAFRKTKNGVRNGFAGVARGQPSGRRSEAGDRGCAAEDRSARVTDGRGRRRGGKAAMAGESTAPAGPKGGPAEDGRLEVCVPALAMRTESHSSCETFYTPTGSPRGSGSFGPSPERQSADRLAGSADAPGGPTHGGSGPGIGLSPFEAPGAAMPAWQAWEEDGVSGRVGSGGLAASPVPRRERSRKKSAASGGDWPLTSVDCIVELRSFSATAGTRDAGGPAPGGDAGCGGLVRSASTNLRPETREELESQLQQLMFGTPVAPELLPPPLAKETSRLQFANDETGAACINQYVIVRSLGQGSHGRVRVCLNALDGRLYAVKTINRAFVPTGLRQRGNNKRARAQSDGILRELAVMKKLDHPNVVKLHEVIDPKGKENIVLITEFMEKGPLLKRLDGGSSGSILFNRMPEARAREVFRSVCAGMDYLHYQGIVHGDLKPDNLLVAANGDVKIADFTCSRMVTPEHFTSGVYGTPAFHAPEVIAGEQYNPYAADVWALGVCIYCAVCGELPFTGAGVMALYTKILACEVTYPKDLDVSADMRDLIARVFVRDANERISMDEMMRHPFLCVDGHPQLVSLRQRTNPPSVIQVSVVEEDDAIDRMSAVSFVRAKLKKKRYRQNDTLFKQGQPATCMYFVLDGSVACLEEYPPACPDEEMLESCSTSLVLDMDESFMMSMVPPAEEAAKDGVLHLERHEVKALRERRREAFLQGEQYERRVGMRGPGQVVGAMEPGAAPTHPYTAIAETTVTVLKLTEEDLQKAFQKESVRRLSKMSYDSSSLRTPEGTESGTGTFAYGATATATTSRDHSTSQSSQV